MDSEEITLHGHRVTYRRAGWGPVVVLIHGITGSSLTWEDVIEPLSEHYTVVAPDLLGHGESAKPRGDYSLGAYASGIRDLIAAIGHDRATVVGHSLGGGVGMQMAYQFPERVERLVLVSSGGLGREVRLVLRAGSDLDEIWRGFSSLADPGARAAFIHTLRTILDPGGQRVSATDRLYLAAEMPSLIMWGERDPIIPVEHGVAASETMPGSRLVTFPDAGHFPYRDDPRRFVRELSEFVDSTEPGDAREERLRELLREGV